MNCMPETANDSDDALAPGPEVDACSEGRQAALRRTGHDRDHTVRTGARFLT
jgi:hypothetical protein